MGGSAGHQMPGRALGSREEVVGRGWGGGSLLGHPVLSQGLREWSHHGGLTLAQIEVSPRPCWGTWNSGSLGYHGRSTFP